MTKKEKNLGRGLSSLICKEDFDELLERPSGVSIINVKIKNVYSNKNQPRKHFDKEALEELASSIKQKGIISPILVREKTQGKFEIIAGERRYRAAKIAGLTAVPILLKEVDDTSALELSIIENVQRQDLNIIEEAKAYHALIGNYSYNQSELSNIVGKSRSHIANILRLLSLPAKVIELLRDGKINLGQAKILIGQDNVEQLANKIIKDNLNVRQVEAFIKKGRPTKQSSTAVPTKSRVVQKDSDIALIESLLREKANLNVQIDNVKKVVQIFYTDLAELDNVLQLLSSK
jgi:ParB family transcriptional regulator, chromosome partitioning protein